MIINPDNSHFAGGFGSNVIPGLPGLAGAKSNVDAAASYVPGIHMKGGGKYLKKKKRKNITKRYKMSCNKRNTKRKSLRKRVRRTCVKKRKSKSKMHSRRRYMKGGSTVSYSLGGIVSANNSALANPTPMHVNPSDYKNAI
jgi:hypothetical protein|tara:strand:+ start:2969 stop:3391 length:423 start_codon:yes stop_codon:yes gene_type:complete